MKISLLLLFSLTLGLSSLSAQELAPTLPAPGPPVTPLLPVDKMAEQAQRELFEATERGNTTNSTDAIPVTGGPIVTSSGRKTTFAAPKLEDPAGWPKDSQRKLAVMEVSFGGAIETVMFELFSNETPMTVSNFLDNCETGSYNGLAFHRAIANFIVQTGDPLTADEGARDRWGTGGESKTVPAEIKRAHRKGAVAMGRRNDNVNPSRKSNGYQFYFALGNYGSMDGKYTVFGQVVSGIETLEKISNMPVDSNDCPIARIEIKSIKVIDHKGPLVAKDEDFGDKRKYSKPAAAKGFMERILERVW
ncbi:cyclophilin family peptidyl-prolyl cis-trans isomerase [Prosthecobacter fusiformis]|uniref:peptidylprolyl isomerase n=1 Tax=Prosthecobacter fusiformis TaxID=48464 RepID=A0A4V3FG34_9BACT|nr:peptidylprolyl isomerase [Prosthecobacter fusiformis]TDU73183.1 cyclophilin family peptidyl-prolyl cis-trans isomerase [Prosthecobacter fusiformis]